MLVLGRDVAYQILFPQLPYEISCKVQDTTCKKNQRNPNLWDLNTEEGTQPALVPEESTVLS